ncbi:GbsR/MarR family transcriptional regulator [Brevibacillus humidisoli]|uniref:GbsR/MarR family transcriptional regulator n=1 Tax=Brevibacillus humidisoli TaxID=2895522 RepID=UPI001E3636E0|nr:GbsR/MarR family transcriptional regulator [Brevibacillus humidisoli]UFJ41906.1 GbsR/MarR family transcriptional regulator [Brevibacillus humidisoli]
MSTHNETAVSQYELIIKKARERVIEALAKNMDLYGITLSIGHLYGTMLFQDKPMTLDEMGEAMGMSKTSMSTGVRQLMEQKMVNKVWMKGARKDHYEVDQDWYQNFIDYFSTKWRKAIDLNVHALRRSLNDLSSLKEKEDLSEELHQLVETDLEKLQNALAYYDWLSRLIDLMESHEIFQYVPKKQ